MKREMLVSVLVCSFAIVTAACSGNSPTAPAPTVASVAVTGPDSNVYMGATTQLNASSTMSNGAAQVPSCTWSSDTPAVATVNATGLVTGAGAGQANIICTSGGREGHKLLRVMPNYSGNWSGSYNVTGCSNSGLFASAGFCNSFPVGITLPYNFILTQTADAVSGRFFLGQIQFDQTSGPVGMDGGLTLASSNTQQGIRNDTIWQLAMPAASRITGNLRQNWTASNASGTATLTAVIRDSMKTSSGGVNTRRTFSDIHDFMNGLFVR
ncbi:MAG TPA: Ig-like domain-containing protein [Vicinamibacterales bacterium]|nr:Ig-like domain-containing protein [Vicinamibacterales bacterium]